MKVLHVTWEDAGQKIGWSSAAEAVNWAEDPNNFIVDSVGLLFGEGEDYIVLVSGMSSGPNVVNPMRIQRKNIIAIEELHNDPKKTEHDQADSDSPPDRGQSRTTQTNSGPRTKHAGTMRGSDRFVL